MKTLLSGLAGVACSMLVMTIAVVMFAAQHTGGVTALA